MAAGEAMRETVESGRLPGLDALRGLAACAVAFGFHAQFMFARGSFAPGDGGLMAAWLRGYGWTAVDLFFVISGYVFAHVYLRGDSLRSIAGQREFWLARLARLYPLHLLLLLVSAWIFRGLGENTLTAFAAHLVMLQALVEPVGHTFVGPTWSLSVEVVCYALFALAALGGRRLLPTVTALAVAGGLAAVLVTRSDDHLTVSTVVARGMLGFFLGQLLWHGRALWVRIPSLVLVLVLIVGLAISPALVGPVPPLVLASWPAVLLLAMRCRWMDARPLVWLGDRSYAIYLLHMPIIDAVTYSTGGLAASPHNLALAWPALIAVTLLASDLIYRRFEVPARRELRAALTARRDGTEPAATVRAGSQF